MVSRFIALEVSASRVRLAVISSGTGRDVEVTSSSSIGLDECAPADLPHDARVAMALKKLLDREQAGTHRAVILLDGQSVFSRTVTLPPVAEDRVEQTIQHEAVQNIPFPLQDVVWDSLAFNPDEPEKEVLLTAVKADLVNGLIHAATANGLKVERILPAPVAMADAIRADRPDPAECILFIESDSSSASLVFVEGDRLFFRTVPRGDEAHFSQDVERSISFYQSQRGGSAPARILVAGDTDPERLGIKAERFLPDFIQHSAGEVSVAIAGAAAPNGYALNLVPAHVQDEASDRLRRGLWIYILSVALIVGAAWAWSLNWTAGCLTRQYVVVDQEVKELAPIEQLLIPIEADIERLLAENDVYLGIDAERDFWRDTLLEIAALLPDGMFLISSEPIKTDGVLTGLQISVVSYLDKEPDGKDAVKLLRDAFRQSERFSEQSRISNRPSKKAFARSFVLDLFFEEDVR